MDDPVAILQKIIDEGGSCDWADSEVCKNCPLGKKLLGSRRINCLDYVLGPEERQIPSREEVDASYLRVAEEELFQLELENLLK